MNILVTGGAGFIGSHTVVELAKEGYQPIIVDNLSNSNQLAVARIRELTGQEIPFYEVDCTNRNLLRDVFQRHEINAVIHFAGFKAVGESVAEPLRYYRNNIDSTLILCEVMQEWGIKRLIFSSSATVYGTPAELPLKETSPTGNGISNPYGWTKYMIEQILRDVAVAGPNWQISLLRYFNPIGAHVSGRIGEDPQGTPNNLLPYICQVAVGKHEKLLVWGDDYDTSDGTGVRDYIHVADVARGHAAALKRTASGLEVYNLGTGRGTSVLELLHAFEAASGKTIPYEIAARRQGDIASCYADPSKALHDLGWKAEKTIEQACADAWRWQSQNPEGYNPH